MNLKGLLPQDVEAVEEYLHGIYEEYDIDIGVAFLLRCSVGRIAANRIREGYPTVISEGWHDPFPRREVLLHILDWLAVDQCEGVPWLENTDDRGRPRKLLKCAGYEDLVREADKSMDRRNAQVAKSLGVADERCVADLEDGYKLVKLLTPEALDLESRRMHHCVGHGSYDAGLAAGHHEIYSLRDRRGRPVATIKINRGEIDQIKGKRNASPEARHIAVLKPLAKAVRWKGRGGFWPYAVDINGVEHDIDEIPAGATFDKLNASIPNGMSVVLPPGLTVLGNMIIGHGIAEIPERLTIGGDVYLSTTRQRSVALPESMHVGGSILTWSGDEIAWPIPAHLAEKIEEAPKTKKMSGFANLIPAGPIDGVQFVFDDPEDDDHLPDSAPR
ncbi:PcfJ domain-containing protein [Mesorhizobium sp. M1409]|uniref:PcfJ domain-containing protein n=1 Tax=unclassified Mesorhizobium TaxID=325217 RepID=UPI00333B136A